MFPHGIHRNLGTWVAALLLLCAADVAGRELKVHFLAALYASPDSTSRVLEVLEDGRSVQVVGEQGGWLQVRAGEQSGWIPNANLRQAAHPIASTPAKPKAGSSWGWLGLLSIPFGVFLGVMIFLRLRRKPAAPVVKATVAAVENPPVVAVPVIAKPVAEPPSAQTPHFEPSLEAQGDQAHFEGVITGEGLSEVLLWLEQGRRSGVLKLRNLQGRNVALLGFDQGILVHVYTREHQGAEAAQRVLAVSQGSFAFFEGASPHHVNCHVQVTGLLLENARRNDERQHELAQRARAEVLAS